MTVSRQIIRHLVLFALVAVTACEQRSFNRLELPLAQGQALSELRFIDDTHLLARNNGEMRVWDVTTRTIERRFFVGQHAGGVAAASFAVSEDGALAATHDGSRIRLLETTAQASERDGFAAPSNGAVWSVLRVSGDGMVVTLAVEPGWNPKSSVLQVWRPGVAHAVWERVLDHPRPFRAFDRSGSRVAVCDGTAVTMLDLSSGRELWSLKDPAASQLAFSSDGRHLAMRQGSRFVVRDASKGAEVGQINPMTGTLLAFPDDLFFLHSDGWVQRVTLTGVTRWKVPLRDDKWKNRPALATAISPRGSRLVLLVENVRMLDLHDAATGAFMTRLARPGDYRQQATVNLIAVSPDDSRVAVAQDSSLVVWKADGSKQFTALSDPALNQTRR